jgi:hypothetical protein
MVVQPFKQFNYAARIHFHNWFLQHVHDGLIDPLMLFAYDKALFLP